MPSPSIRVTQRLISAFTNAEPWKIDHDEAMLCRDLEDSMAWAVRLMNGLAEDEARLQNIARGATAEDCEVVVAKFDNMRKELVDGCRAAVPLVESLMQQGYRVDGVGEFRQALEEAQNMLDAAEFERELPPLEELRRLVRPNNPRPERYGD